MTDALTSPFAAGDLANVRGSLDAINISADQVSKSLTGAFTKAAAGGKSLDQTLQSVALSLAKIALKGGMGNLSSGLSSLLGGLSFEGGEATPVQAFAEGGVVARPTFFGTGSGLGLMGERGAEAIMPLARGPDGRLGLAATQGAARQAQVNVQISAADPESFRQSQVQIAGALARAVARGQRGF